MKKQIPHISRNDVATLIVYRCDPSSEFFSVWNCCRQEHIMDHVGEHDDGLLPHHAALCVQMCTEVRRKESTKKSLDKQQTIKAIEIKIKMNE